MWYQNYAHAIVTRRNTITGVLYNQDPAIIGWELANEAWNPGDDTGNVLQVNWCYMASAKDTRALQLYCSDLTKNPSPVLQSLQSGDMGLQTLTCMPKRATLVVMSEASLQASQGCCEHAFHPNRME